MLAGGETVRLSVVDYVVFGILLAVSAAVGFFFAYRDRKKKSSVNYLLGNRKVSWWASGLSCSLSFYSGSTVIGVPAEIMYRGSAYVWVILGSTISMIIGCEVFLPIYYKNGMTSAIEYFGKRFGKYARYAATLIYILQTIAFTGVMIYAPAIAFDAVSDLTLTTAILSTGIVCTIYTTLGGLKAVIWTDVIQFIILTGVSTVTLFVAAGNVGGIAKSVQIAWEGGRVDFNHFEFDPRYRITFWSAAFGLGIMWTSIAATNQAIVQRFLCCRSIKEGKMALYTVTALSPFQFAFLLTFTGYVLYAYFADCDPIASGTLASEDQVLPYMVLKVFSDTPGVPGLFIAGVFAGALSTVSSTINAVASVTTEDIIRPIAHCRDQTLLWIARGLTLAYGALCIGFAFLASALGSVVQASLSLLGLCSGALLGTISMGVLFPVANEKGVIAGMVAALSFNMWLFAGAWMYPPPPQFLNIKPRSVEGCDIANDTTFNMSTNFVAQTITEAAEENTTTHSTTGFITMERPAIADFYAVSFMYYAPLGLFVSLAVGLLISVLTGGLKSRYQVDPGLICLPFEHPLLHWLPYSFRQFMIPQMGNAKQSINNNIQNKQALHGSRDKLECEIDSIHSEIVNASSAMDNKAFEDDDGNYSTDL